MKNTILQIFLFCSVIEFFEKNENTIITIFLGSIAAFITHICKVEYERFRKKSDTENNENENNKNI